MTAKMMEYFHLKKSKPHDNPEPEIAVEPVKVVEPVEAEEPEGVVEPEKAEEPVLTAEDEAFLHRIATEGTPPPLPARPLEHLPLAGETAGNESQVALFDGPQNIPLPEVLDTPEQQLDRSLGDEKDAIGKGKAKAKSSRPLFTWSFHRRDSRDRKIKDKETTATDLMSVAEGLKAHPHEGEPEINSEVKKEEEELTAVLDQLNLAAVNNRAFSISKESQELLRKFTLVLKDLVNGVPTAYQDLESLLTNSEQQLQRSYKHLPDFLQKLIEQLPSKMTESITPELLAAAAERPALQKSAAKFKMPSLKDLVTKPGAVAGMLRAIMNFLKLRFPAFLGMNVLYSLALFVLLFVFWYCHKRGREVRLEKERLLTEAELEALNKDHNDNEASSSATTTFPSATTSAPDGAPIDEVRNGLHSEAPEEEAPYAPEGSLGRELRREDEERRAKEGKEIKDKGEEKAGTATNEEARGTEPTLDRHAEVP